MSFLDLLRRALGTAPTPAPEPTPEPAPEPVPTPEVPEPTPPVETPTGLKVETKARGQFIYRTRAIPYEGGSQPIDAEKVTGTVIMNRIRITNLGSKPVVIRPSKSGPNNPKVGGIGSAGKSLASQESIVLTNTIGPLTVTVPGGTARSHFGVHLVDGTRIVGGTVQVEYPN